MSLLDIAKKRYSVRKYEDKPVEKEKLEKILACAHVAPTAANLQPVKLLVVQDKERLKSIAKAGNIYNAPLAIIVCADHSKALAINQKAFLLHCFHHAHLITLHQYSL